MPEAEVGPALADELKAVVVEHLGKAYKPDRVVIVGELPKTRSAKILRRAIRSTVMGEDPGDLSGLENPTALEQIRSSLA
jgi:acetyl-CoA synthetase